MRDGSRDHELLPTHISHAVVQNDQPVLVTVLDYLKQWITLDVIGREARWARLDGAGVRWRIR